MIRVTASEARQALSDILNRVAYGGDRIALCRRGKPVAVVVSVEDAALLEELEDRMDLEAARKALKEKGSIPLEQVESELGL